MPVFEDALSPTMRAHEYPVYEGIPRMRFSDTQDMEQINKAVYSGEVSLQSMVSKNPFLTEEHIRHLLKQNLWRKEMIALLKNPSLSTELLYELASTEENPFYRGFIAIHPNVDEATKVYLALMGYDDVSLWE